MSSFRFLVLWICTAVLGSVFIILAAEISTRIRELEHTFDSSAGGFRDWPRWGVQGIAIWLSFIVLGATAQAISVRLQRR